MIKINYSSKPANKNNFLIFENACLNQFFLVQFHPTKTQRLAQKVSSESDNDILIDVQDGCLYFRPSEIKKDLSSSEYSIVPVDVEITVITK